MNRIAKPAFMIVVLLGLVFAVSQITYLYDKQAFLQQIPAASESTIATSTQIAQLLPANTPIQATFEITPSLYWANTLDQYSNNKGWLVDLDRATATVISTGMPYSDPWTISFSSDYRMKHITLDADSYDGHGIRTFYFDEQGEPLGSTDWWSNFFEFTPPTGSSTQVSLVYDGCTFEEDGDPNDLTHGTVTAIRFGKFGNETVPLKRPHDVTCDSKAVAIGGYFPTVNIGKPVLTMKDVNFKRTYIITSTLPWGTPIEFSLDDPRGTLHSADFKEEYPFKDK